MKVRDKENRRQCTWCGTVYRPGHRICSRGAACPQEEREWNRLTSLARGPEEAKQPPRRERRRIAADQ